MTVDDFTGRRRYPFLRLAMVAVVVCAAAGATFLTVHSRQSTGAAFAPPPLPAVDPLQTGSVAGEDSIGGMIEKLGGQGGGTTK